MKIFISGSKSISKLPELAKIFIDQFIENNDEILIGDCYGVDVAVQKYLESKGYSVQMLEFIDMEHTPKNILIRAVKTGAAKEKSSKEAEAFTVALGLVPTLKRLL